MGRGLGLVTEGEEIVEGVGVVVVVVGESAAVVVEEGVVGE